MDYFSFKSTKLSISSLIKGWSTSYFFLLTYLWEGYTSVLINLDKFRLQYIFLIVSFVLSRSVFYKEWKCHHSSKNKFTKTAVKNRITGRNTKGTSKLTIKIKKVSKGTNKNDPYLKLNPPLQAVITVDTKHSHNLECTDALRLLRPTAEVKDFFFWRNSIVGWTRQKHGKLTKASFCFVKTALSWYLMEA